MWKLFLESVNWANAAALLVESINTIFNKLSEVPSGVEVPVWVLIGQAVIALFSTSFLGLAHRLAHKEAQVPANRTIGEVTASAVAVAATTKAAAPAGASVTVPAVKATPAKGTGEIVKP